MNVTVVLVHGAMHTPWIFNPLRERLSARGISSRAVQLPSSNPDSAATRGLIEDVATVRAEIDSVDGPVVLAAHSYGGVPATWAAADADQVTELVYIAAFALEPGVSTMKWMGGDFPPTAKVPNRDAPRAQIKTPDLHQSPQKRGQLESP